MSAKNAPTIFHITHPKAGSQWVMQVLHESAPERFVQPENNAAHFYKKAIQPGMIYPTLYLSQRQFYTVLNPEKIGNHQKPISSLVLPIHYLNWFRFGVLKKPYRTFIVIRDLRDTLISLYFSLKHSHPLINEGMSEIRVSLNEISKEDGLLHLMNTEIKHYHQLQLTWLSEETLLVRYEELLSDEFAGFQKIMDHCEINISEKSLRKIIERNSFQTRSGRPQGSEDITSHYRKGISGDWRNHFSDRIKSEFKDRYGRTLIRTGYEKNLNW